MQGLFDDVVVEPFFVEDDVRLYGAAAGIAFGDARRILHILGIEEFMAVGAEVAVDAAVKFEDVFAAGFLMEDVDVLGDDSL